MWIALTGLALGGTPARAQEPQGQGTDEGEAPALEVEAEEQAPAEPPSRPEPARPRPPARPFYAPTPTYAPAPVYAPAPIHAPAPVYAPAPTAAPVNPSPRPVIIRQRPMEISPVVGTAPPAYTSAPVPAPTVSQAAPAPAAPAVPVTPSAAVPSTSLPSVPARYAVKGLTEVEGGLNFSYARLPRGSSATFALNPAIRRFVSDGLAVGGTVELRVIKDGPKSFTILPDAEYNFSFGDGRLYEFVMLGLGVRYVSSGSASATNIVFRPGLGTKLTFGGGLVALGLAVPIAFSDPVEIGLDIMTRYAVFF